MSEMYRLYGTVKSCCQPQIIGKFCLKIPTKLLSSQKDVKEKTGVLFTAAPQKKSDTSQEVLRRSNLTL